LNQELHMKLDKILLAAGAAVLLAACGDSPPAELPAPPAAGANAVPASATASIASYAQYAGSLPKSETDEPLDVSQVVPPTSETELPVAVN
jgi:uncharacterized lipoprotein YajG